MFRDIDSNFFWSFSLVFGCDVVGMPVTNAVFVHCRKNGENHIQNLKGKWQGVLEKAKKSVCRGWTITIIQYLLLIKGI